MITEDYCSYEVAKLLKEKGFDEKTLTYYEDGKICHGDWFEWNNSPMGQISAPSQAIAMKWLTVKHNIYYEIQLLLGEKAEKYGGLQLGIYQLSSSGAYVWKDWIYADTYVELYENYIKYCLENLI